MQGMNFDRIGDDLAKAYEEGFEENKINNKFEDLIALVGKWGDEKGITHSENIDKQFMKFIEEVFEFKTELDFSIGLKKDEVIAEDFYEALNLMMANQFNYKHLCLEMGDIFVTLIILSKQLEIDLVVCLEMAYEKISKRKGKTIDGTFIKEEDL